MTANKRGFVRILFCLLAVGCGACRGQLADGGPGLRNAVVLIIRHAEKTEAGPDLSPEGYKRARAYADYFRHFEVDSNPLQLSALFAAGDSKSSRRPRLTLEPLSAAVGLPIETRFKAREAARLAEELKSAPHGNAILICWHHAQIPDLIEALGGDPNKLLPHGKWHSEVFNWVIELRYDEQGRLISGQSKRINENLMPGDSATHESRQPSDGAPEVSRSQGAAGDTAGASRQ